MTCHVFLLIFGIASGTTSSSSALLLVFCWTWPLRRVDCLFPPPVRLVKMEATSLSVLPKDTTSKLVELFFTLSLLCGVPNRETFFKVFWYDLNWKTNSRSTDCKVVALTTKPSSQLVCDKINVMNLPCDEITSSKYEGVRRLS